MAWGMRCCIATIWPSCLKWSRPPPELLGSSPMACSSSTPGSRVNMDPSVLQADQQHQATASAINMHKGPFPKSWPSSAFSLYLWCVFLFKKELTPEITHWLHSYKVHFFLPCHQIQNGAFCVLVHDVCADGPNLTQPQILFRPPPPALRAPHRAGASNVWRLVDSTCRDCCPQTGRQNAGRLSLEPEGGGALPGGVQFDPLGTQFQPGDPWGRRGKGSVSILSQSAESSASELDPTGEGVINE